ncbi:Ras-related protein RABA5d, partial [Linum perenne]
FNSHSKTTIGVEFQVEIDNKEIKVHIWDVDQERFHAVTSAYYRDVVLTIMIFNLPITRSP